MKEQLAESKMHALDYWQVIRNRWGVILLTFFLVLLASLVIVALLDKKYVGRTSLQVNNNSKGIIFGDLNEENRFNLGPNFLETQFKIITSPETLLRVINKKNLKARWDMSEDEAMSKLRRMIETEEERGTEIINIEVYSTTWDEAAELANAVREAYEDRRKETEQDRVGRIVGVLNGKLKAQETEVEESRIEMMQLMKQYGIVDLSIMSGRGLSPTIGTGDQSYSISQQNVLEMKTKVATLRANLESMQKQTNEQLIENASSYGVENSTIQTFDSQLKKDRVEYERMTNSGFGKRHPKVIGLRKSIEETGRILLTAAGNYKESLGVTIKNLEEALKRMEDISQEKKVETVEEKQNSAEYTQSKTRYEMKLDLLQALSAYGYIPHFPTAIPPCNFPHSAASSS